MSKHKVMYNITTSHTSNGSLDLKKNKFIQNVIELFKKYDIEWNTCDTVPGSFNLNQEWIETNSEIEAEVEWGSVLPINWSKSDKDIFLKLISQGKIVVVVHWIEKDAYGETKYVLNH